MCIYPFWPIRIFFAPFVLESSSLLCVDKNIQDSQPLLSNWLLSPMSATIASAQLAYAHAEKIKNNDVKLQGQTSFNDWKDAIEDHAKSVKVATGAHAHTVFADTLAPGFALLAAHIANPANVLQPPPAPQRR